MAVNWSWLVKRCVTTAAGASLAVFGGAVSASNDDRVVVIDSNVPGGLLTPTFKLDASGNPVIAYRDNVNVLRVVHCNDPSCVGGDESVGGFPGPVEYTSLQLDAAGRPVISYRDATTGALHLAHCNDANCANGDESISVVDAGVDTGYWSSLEMDAAGNPIISYVDRAAGVLRLAHCNDPNCSGDDESLTTIAAASVSRHDLELDSAGNPVVAFHADSSLRLARCGDPNCSVGGVSVSTVHEPRGGGSSGEYASLELRGSGNPVISFYAYEFFDGSRAGWAHLAQCDDVSCTSARVTSLNRDEREDTGAWTSLEVDDEGIPVVSSYARSWKIVELIRCRNVSCSRVRPPTTISSSGPGPVGTFETSMELNAAGNPVVLFIDRAGDTGQSVNLVHCNDASCESDTTGPTATIGLADGQGPSAQTGPAEFDVVFNETVNGFEASDVMVGGTAGATSVTVSGSGSAYLVTVATSAGSGTITIGIPAGAVEDRFGNASGPSVVDRDTVTIDTATPVLVLPGSASVTAATAPGAATVAVDYVASAIDDVDGMIPATCSPSSGAEFGIGATTVTCSATDRAGNSTSDAFVVKVSATPGPVETLPETGTLSFRLVVWASLITLVGVALVATGRRRAH